MSDYVCPVAVFSASTRFEIRAPEPNLRLPETPDSRIISVQIATQHVRWPQSSLQFSYVAISAREVVSDSHRSGTAPQAFLR